LRSDQHPLAQWGDTRDRDHLASIGQAHLSGEHKNAWGQLLVSDFQDIAVRQPVIELGVSVNQHMPLQASNLMVFYASISICWMADILKLPWTKVFMSACRP
jgi:hypothetical protein